MAFLAIFVLLSSQVIVYVRCQCDGTPASVPLSMYSTLSVDSPGYPSPYTTNLDCVWMVSSDTDLPVYFIIRIHETFIDCKGDSIQLAKSPGDVIVDNYCGEATSSTIVTMETDGDSKLRVVFTADGVSRGEKDKGFRVEITSIPNIKSKDPGSLVATTTDQVLISDTFPGLYTSNSHDEWRISASSGFLVQLTIDFIDIEGDGTTCQYDFLEIIYTTDSSEYTTLYCGNWKFRPVFSSEITSEEDVRITFTSDGSSNYRGFQLRYKYIGQTTTAQPTTETDKLVTTATAKSDTTSITSTTPQVETSMVTETITSTTPQVETSMVTEAITSTTPQVETSVVTEAITSTTPQVETSAVTETLPSATTEVTNSTTETEMPATTENETLATTKAMGATTESMTSDKTELTAITSEVASISPTSTRLTTMVDHARTDTTETSDTTATSDTTTLLPKFRATPLLGDRPCGLLNCIVPLMAAIGLLLVVLCGIIVVLGVNRKRKRGKHSFRRAGYRPPLSPVAETSYSY